MRERLPLVFEELCEQRLKNVPRPVRVVRLRPDGPAAHPAVRATKPLLRRRVWLGSILVGAVLLFVAGYLVLERRPTEEPKSSVATAGAPRIRSLAVLPLENLSGDPGQEYFADGMTEVVIGNLAKLGELRVISRTSVMHYKGVRKPLPEIARELGVDAVDEGSVLRAGDRVRITAQLIDARDDSHVWSESYDRELADVLALQADVARAIARAVHLELASGKVEERRIDPRAYDAFLAGWQQIAVSERGNLQAVATFQRATELEPQWASAWGGLATALSCTCVWTTPSEGMARARAAADRALALDPENVEGLSALALVQTFGDWDWEAGRRSARRAVELQPSVVWFRFVYGVVLSAGGDFDGAMAQHERMRELDPLGPNPTVAAGYARRGDERRAEAEFQRLLQLHPSSPRVLRFAGGHYCESGEPARGLPLLDRSNELEPQDTVTLAALGWCRALSGDAAGARHILAELDTLADSVYVDPARVALVHLALGDREAALAELERALEVRAFFLPFVPRDPRFDALRDDPRFTELMSRAKLPFRAGSDGSRVADPP